MESDSSHPSPGSHDRPSGSGSEIHGQETWAPSDTGVPIAERSDQADAVPEPPAKVSGKPRFIGDYELLDEIARGGMGVVYRARQKKLNRIVALKMILAGHLASQAEVKRFYTEAEAAATLDHANIVPIYEVGEEDGQHFFSMGLVEGESLAHRIRNGPLEPRLAAELSLTISEAMVAAHEVGVIHRDLKPANILLDQDGSPKVTDFGLAKRQDVDSDLTATGQMLGTPSYMPPEQAAGKVDEVGPRSDVYSLGAILYCLLTGRPPFQAATAIETLGQVQNREPLAPRQLNPAVDVELETICLKCLEKEPSRRYQTAQQLVDELRRFLHHEPIMARPLGRTQRAWRWCRRNPGSASWIAIFLTTLMIGAGGIFSQWRRAEHEAQLAREAAVNATNAADNAGVAADRMLEVIDEWIEQISESDNKIKTRINDVLTVYKRSLAEESDDAAARSKMAKTQRQVANVYRKLGEFGLASQHYNNAIVSFQRLVADETASLDHRHELANSYYWLAETHRQADRPQDAADEYGKAIGILERLTLDSPAMVASQFHHDLARASYGMGLAQFTMDRYDEAKANYKVAIRHLETLQNQSNSAAVRLDLARCCNRLGFLWDARNQVLEANSSYEMSIDLLTALRAELREPRDCEFELALASLNRGNLFLVHGDKLEGVTEKTSGERARRLRPGGGDSQTTCREISKRATVSGRAGKCLDRDGSSLHPARCGRSSRTESRRSQAGLCRPVERISENRHLSLSV